MEGRSQTVNSTVFRVRQLPDPMPFISYKDNNGNIQRYRGGKPFLVNHCIPPSGEPETYRIRCLFKCARQRSQPRARSENRVSEPQTTTVS